MIFTEEQLRKYAKPLSETEENQCKNAIRAAYPRTWDIEYKKLER